MSDEELRDFRPVHETLRKRKVEPKYQEAYDRINRITPDRPSNHLFQILFEDACREVDMAEKTIGGPMYKEIDHFRIERDEKGIEHAVAVRKEHSAPSQPRSLMSRLKNLFFRPRPESPDEVHPTEPHTTDSEEPEQTGEANPQITVHRLGKRKN